MPDISEATQRSEPLMAAEKKDPPPPAPWAVQRVGSAKRVRRSRRSRNDIGSNYTAILIEIYNNSAIACLLLETDGLAVRLERFHLFGFAGEKGGGAVRVEAKFDEGIRGGGFELEAADAQRRAVAEADHRRLSGGVG